MTTLWNQRECVIFYLPTKYIIQMLKQEAQENIPIQCANIHTNTNRQSPVDPVAVDLNQQHTCISKHKFDDGLALHIQ